MPGLISLKMPATVSTITSLSMTPLSLATNTKNWSRRLVHLCVVAIEDVVQAVLHELLGGCLARKEFVNLRFSPFLEGGLEFALEFCQVFCFHFFLGFDCSLFILE